MKRNLGRLLLLIGLVVMLIGLGMAFKTFAGIYYDATSDPLGEHATSAEPEKDAAKAMLKWAIVGIAGAPIAAVGAFLAMKARIDRIKARNQARR
ncbi:MAG: hypothetical protein NCW75_05965 [Phycisphaera sp.]|nr:MAG: hypothetical protein NCW75_05965 [Phycisphaera sp.]